MRVLRKPDTHDILLDDRHCPTLEVRETGGNIREIDRDTTNHDWRLHERRPKYTYTSYGHAISNPLETVETWYCTRCRTITETETLA